MKTSQTNFKRKGAKARRREDTFSSFASLRLCVLALKSKAFTLLEVLIAVAIFSIVLAAMNAVFYGAIKLRNKSTENIEAALPIERALAIIKRDLAGIVPPSGPLSGVLQTTATTNTVLPGQMSPDFFTATGIVDDTAPWGDIQKISYVLANSTDGTAGKNLFRAVSRNLLATQPEIPPQQFLLSGVQNLFFYFYDGAQWQTAWDSAATTNLPLAIKVQIQLAPKNSANALVENAPLELVIPLDAQTTNQLTAVSDTTDETEGGTE